MLLPTEKLKRKPKQPPVSSMNCGKHLDWFGHVPTSRPPAKCVTVISRKKERRK